jgi:hypothetical protein
MKRYSTLALGLAISGGLAGMIAWPTLVSAAPVEVQAINEDAVKTLDAIGREVASRADARLKAEVGTYARENLFGITGDLIPSGTVAFNRAGVCTVDGRTGVVFEFDVHARAKVDVGQRKLFVHTVVKVWAVDTKQRVQVVILPKQKDDGSVVAEVSAEIVSATATPERQAKQRDADGFRDRVSSAIKEKLSGYTGEHDAQGILDRVK